MLVYCTLYRAVCCTGSGVLARNKMSQRRSMFFRRPMYSDDNYHVVLSYSVGKHSNSVGKHSNRIGDRTSIFFLNVIYCSVLMRLANQGRYTYQDNKGVISTVHDTSVAVSIAIDTSNVPRHARNITRAVGQHWKHRAHGRQSSL